MSKMNKIIVPLEAISEVLSVNDRFTRKDYDQLKNLVNLYEARSMDFRTKFVNIYLAKFKVLEEFVYNNKDCMVDNIGYNNHNEMLMKIPEKGRIRVFAENEVECINRLLASKMKDISLLRIDLYKKMQEIASKIDYSNSSLNDVCDSSVIDYCFITAAYECMQDINDKVTGLNNVIIDINDLAIFTRTIGHDSSIENGINKVDIDIKYITSQNFNDLFDMIKPGLESLLQRYPNAERLVKIKKSINKVGEKSSNNISNLSKLSNDIKISPQLLNSDNKLEKIFLINRLNAIE